MPRHRLTLDKTVGYGLLTFPKVPGNAYHGVDLVVTGVE
jgi:hypothetical protein